MALVLEILLGLAILASFFIAYMSARTWPIVQVVLVAFLFLGTVAFFYLSARTLKTHDAWRKVVNNAKAEVERLQRDTKLLVEGAEPNAEGLVDPKGIRQLQQDMQKLTIDRGGVLYGVPVDSVTDGVVQLTLPSTVHGLEPGMVVFAFSEVPRQEGGHYLGEFKVTQVGDDTTKVQIAPNLPLTAEQAARLAAATGPLTLYMTMPIDDTAVFSSLDDATRGALLPAASSDEFAKPERTLHDYEQYFHEHFVQVSLLNDAINKLNSNIARMTAATTEAEKEGAFRQGEKVKLAADLAQFDKEKQAIAAYQESLAQVQRDVVEKMKASFVANRQMAAQITASQLRAAQEIDQRSNSAAAQP
ncbi:MAG: hypothetical protein WD845_15245 [Pirellulales bacterium]